MNIVDNKIESIVIQSFFCASLYYKTKLTKGKTVRELESY